MKKPIYIIFTILILIGGFILFKHLNKKGESEPLPVVVEDGTQEDIIHLKEPTFEWSYRSFLEREIPRTVITLTARDTNGVVQAKEVDTIEGGCNEYGELDPDVYSKSKMIICYYAGLGRYYKVVKSDGGYNVERKIFEEGSLEYNPPSQQFETIARF